MEKRIVLAVVLSILIILTFQYFIPKPPILPPPSREVATENVMPAGPAKEAAIGQYAPQKISYEEENLEVETEKHILTFTDLGGAIKNIRLKDYKDLNSGEPLGLVQIKNPKEYLFSINSPLGDVLPDLAGYRCEKDNDTITYSLRTQELEIIKRYLLHKDKYIIELQLFIKNLSSAPKKINYRIICGSGLSEPNIQDKRFVEASSKINDKILNFKRPKQEHIINPGIVSWTALKSKYFSVIFKPFVKTKNQFYGENEAGDFVMGLEPEEATIGPNSDIENKFMLYAGPGQAHILKETGYDFGETINYGFFGGISKILISVMRFFYGIVRNWGVSVILLSIFLNIILYPLTVKSFKSMRKMQELHPQMEKLKAQHKDNPQKLNKEIMELYKKYNINPLSGCLPMLLQMPIFIALYQGLIRSIELRSAGFLWIKDLSLPDAVKIPLSLPVIGSSINILPLIMVAAMVIQQKMSTKTMGGAVTEEQKQQQKMMLILMPIMFGFIFYNMPSGLVLYWVVNTVLTIVEQAMIFKSA